MAPFYRLTFASILMLALLACNRPIARFTFSDEELQAPATVSFANASERAEQYLWSFGDGDTSTAVEPDHRFRRSGTYTVTLEARRGKRSRARSADIVIAPPDRSLVELETPYGNMLIELYDATPEHRDNFMKLAEEGFYDSLLFHRVIEGFMIQGGDPDSRGAAPGQMLGRGGPGYTLPAEFVDTLLHLRGALAAARQGDAVNPEKRSSGSQFYIVQGKPLSEEELAMIERRNSRTYTDQERNAYREIGGTPFLDGSYTVFGRVVEGLEVLDRIGAVSTDPRDRPMQDVWIVAYPIR